jgi:hypothetical protein
MRRPGDSIDYTVSLRHKGAQMSPEFWLGTCQEFSHFFDWQRFSRRLAPRRNTNAAHFTG